MQFAKAFKRYYEMAPAQWRKRAGSEEAIADVIAIDCRCGCQRSERPQLGSPRAQESPVRELGSRRGQAGRIEEPERRVTELDPAAA